MLNFKIDFMTLNHLKTFTALALIALLMCSCEKNQEATNDVQEIYLKDGIIAYKNIDVFLEYTLEANSSTIEERILMEKELGFYSLQTSYEVNLKEFEGLSDEKSEDWVATKSKYWDIKKVDGTYVFNYPIPRTIDAYGVNADSKVYISGNLCDLKNPDDWYYKELNAPTHKHTSTSTHGHTAGNKAGCQDQMGGSTCNH